MEKKIKNNMQPRIQNGQVVKVNKHLKLLGLIAVSMLLMGCWIAELWNDMSDSSFWEPAAVQITGDGEPTSEVIELGPPKQSGPKPNPTSPPVALPESAPDSVGTNEYTVSAQDFSCICRVDGNVNVELRVNGDQLEIIDPGGNVQVYDKIGENTYKRSWMGYYISVVDGQETRVDEEKSVVVILTDTGYIMEHYSGSEGSACCIHTFSQINK